MRPAQPNFTSTAGRQTRWLLPAAVCVATFLAFLPVLQNGFVNWDDEQNILRNTGFRGFGWTELSWMFTTFHMSLYRPLTWLSMAVDHHLWGMNPGGFHLTSLLIHAVNSLVFYFVALRLLRVGLPQSNAMPSEAHLRLGAAFAALLFSLHPLRVEPVAWASSRNDVLSGFFFLATVLCYLKAAAAGETNGGTGRWLIASWILYAFSLLSKASGLTLPFLLIILDLFMARERRGRGLAYLGSPRAWLQKAPFFLFAFAAGAVGLVAKQQAGALGSVEAYGFLPRIFQAVYGIGFYLWKTIFPFYLSPIYELGFGFDPWDRARIVTGVSVLTITAALLMARRRWPAGLAAWIGYIVILAPMLGFAQSGPQLVADRYSYLASLPWATLMAAGLLLLWQQRFHSRLPPLDLVFMAPVAAIALLGGLAVGTWRQTGVWHDSETLWSRAAALQPESSLAHHNLAVELAKQPGKLEEAVAHLREALSLNPNFPDAHTNLANVLAAQGELKEATRHYHQALEIDPHFASSHRGLGNLLAGQGAFDRAIEQYRKALETAPDNPETLNNLATALLKVGLREEAARHYREALRISPQSAAVHYNFANLLASEGKTLPAIEHYQKALQLRPEAGAIHESLARALALAGREEEAIEHYQEAIRILRGSKP